MKNLLAILALSAMPLLAASQVAGAQEAPQFMKDTFPQQGLKAAWQEHQDVMNPNGALNAKEKELISLGVAAQIPCDYCIYYHTQAAKHAGATDAQIKEALAAAALTRKWSTMLNGSDYDMSKFKTQVSAMFGKPGGTTGSNR
jgi:AhpD family alkylhydroperoxidase